MNAAVAPDLPPAMVEYWRQNGYRHALMSIWVSNITNNEVAAVKQILLSAARDCLLQLRFYDQPEIVEYYGLISHFDEVFSGSFSYNKTAYRGNYLYLFVPIDSDQSYNLAREKSELISNIIRLQLGAASIARLAFQQQIDLLKGIYIGRPPNFGLGTPFGTGRDGDSFVQNSVMLGLTSTQLKPLSSISSKLLTQAFDNLGSSFCFFYLWCILEVEIGDGRARRSFCIDELGSTIISEEMKRLHGIRGRIAHEGDISSASGADSAIALEFVRLALMPNSQNRKTLVKHLEAVLSDKSLKSKLSLGGTAQHVDISIEPICPPELSGRPDGPIIHPFLLDT